MQPLFEAPQYVIMSFITYWEGRMTIDWKSIADKVLVGVFTAVALGVLTLLWNLGSNGGIVRALGGITQKEAEDIAKRIVVPPSSLSLIAGGQVDRDGTKQAWVGPTDFSVVSVREGYYRIKFANRLSVDPLVVAGSTDTDWSVSAVVSKSSREEFTVKGLYYHLGNKSQNPPPPNPDQDQASATGFWFLVFPRQ
jgi:hypothetical protein